MRSGIPLIAFCVLASASALAGQIAHEKAAPANVFLITIDTLRADHIHCYGYDRIRTPALDSLAASGILFSNAFTPAPITNVSHASILTGLQPSSHGVTDFGMPLAPSHPTWAQILKEKGYQTAAFIGAIILDSKSLAPGFDRGFDFYDNFPEQPANSQKLPRWGRVERRGFEVVSHAESWLNAHPSGPRFAWIHLYDPHDPYEPPPPFSVRYKDRLYDGEIAYADSALSSFLQFLKAKGWYENSLIIIVGDHGEGLGEHNEETHGIFLYDSTTHVPLIIKLPFESHASTVVTTQVRTTDILPTTLELLDIAKPASFDGESLKPLLDGNGRNELIALGSTNYPLLFGWSPLRSVRQDETKYIEAPRPELYDLKTDPGELHNLYEPWDERVKKSRALLAKIKPPTPAPDSPVAVSANTLDELRALGYLGRADVGSSTTAPEPSFLPDPKDKIEEMNLLHTAMLAEDDSRLDAARSALVKLLQQDPDFVAALQQLGQSELQTGDSSDAAKHLKRAHELRPNDASIGFSLAQALKKTGDFTGARDMLEASLKIAPDQFQARLLLGEIYLFLKNGSEAVDQFQAALLLQEGNSDATMGLARADLSVGNPAGAIQTLEPLSFSPQNNAEVFDLLAQAYRKTGEIQRAQAAETTAKRMRTKKSPGN